jgi:hypothetical protein
VLAFAIAVVVVRVVLLGKVMTMVTEPVRLLISSFSLFTILFLMMMLVTNIF